MGPVLAGPTSSFGPAGVGEAGTRVPAEPTPRELMEALQLIQQQLQAGQQRGIELQNAVQAQQVTIQEQQAHTARLASTPASSTTPPGIPTDLALTHFTQAVEAMKEVVEN